jgi:DnaJ-class molecular chaperone
LRLEGATIHTKCNGTGLLEIHDDGTVKICPECMGSGIIEEEFEMGDHYKWVRSIDMPEGK